MKQPVDRTSLPEAPLDFEAIYSASLSFLRHALRWLGVPEPDRDDVLQDVMLAAYRNLPSFDPAYDGAPPCDAQPGGHRGRDVEPIGEPLKRWLFGIARRQVGHYRAKAHRRRELAVGAGASWPFDPIDTGPSSEQLLAREQQSHLVSRLLGALEMDRRVVLIMSDVLDASIPEIARELRLKENTVRNRLRVARAEFRLAVKRMNAEERRALPLRVAELSQKMDERDILRAARAIPEAPQHVRLQIWTALSATRRRVLSTAKSKQRVAAPLP